MNEVFEGVFREGRNIYTVNLVPGSHVYGEKLTKIGNVEYREWDPSRSKLGAALMNGLKNMPIKKGSRILYLGASTGTTVSHMSDIIGLSGIIYGIEFAERVFRNLAELSGKRRNIAPILADARKPEEYYWIEECDVSFCDIAQPDESEIAIRNAKEFLKKEGFLILSVKSQSIDVTKKPEQVYTEESQKLKNAGYEILEMIDLEPYEKNHCLIIAKLSNNFY